MNQDNRTTGRNDRQGIYRYLEAIEIQLRRIQTFIQNVTAGTLLTELLERTLIRPMYCFVTQGANNLEQEYYNFTQSLHNFLEIDWSNHCRHYLVQIQTGLEDTAEVLRTMALVLRHMMDPLLDDTPLHELLLGDRDNAGATDEEIEQLNKVVAGGIDEEERCAICLDGYMQEQELLEMPCGHVFHASCAAVWLQRKAICPIDRMTIFHNRRTRTLIR